MKIQYINTINTGNNYFKFDLNEQKKTFPGTSININSVQCYAGQNFGAKLIDDNGNEVLVGGFTNETTQSLSKLINFNNANINCNSLNINDFKFGTICSDNLNSISLSGEIKENTTTISNLPSNGMNIIVGNYSMFINNNLTFFKPEKIESDLFINSDLSEIADFINQSKYLVYLPNSRANILYVNKDNTVYFNTTPLEELTIQQINNSTILLKINKTTPITPYSLKNRSRTGSDVQDFECTFQTYITRR